MILNEAWCQRMKECTLTWKNLVIEKLPYLNNALRTSGIRDKPYEIRAKFCHEVCSNMATCAKKSGHIIKTQMGAKIDTQWIYSRHCFSVPTNLSHVNWKSDLTEVFKMHLFVNCISSIWFFSTSLDYIFSFLIWNLRQIDKHYFERFRD